MFQNIQENIPDIIKLDSLRISTALEPTHAALLQNITAQHSNFVSKSADKLMERSKLGVISILSKDEQDLIGHIGLMPFHYGGKDIYERSTLRTHPDYQGQGIGTYLMKTLTKMHSHKPLISISKNDHVKHINHDMGFHPYQRKDIRETNLHQELKKYGGGQREEGLGREMFMNEKMKELFEKHE